MDPLFAYLRRRPDPAPDAALLARHLDAADPDALAELVRRHARLVYGTCRRLLADPHDADDAAQAVWLVLVRRAPDLRRHPAVGPWLHRTAVLTARNLVRRNALRRKKGGPLGDPSVHPADPDSRLDLDAALLALPDKYRVPIVLCHLEGWPRADAAARLGCPEGTLSARLSRGLAKLKARLGGTEPLSLLAVAATAAVPAGAVSATARAVEAYRATGTTAGLSPVVCQLVTEGLRMYRLKKLAAVGLAVAAVTGVGTGVVLVAQTPVPTNPGEPLGGLPLHISPSKSDDLKPLAPSGPRLLLSPGPGRGEVTVTEYSGTPVRAIGALRCSTPDILMVYLTRTRKDTAAPTAVTVEKPADAPAAANAIVSACKAAGFTDVAVIPRSAGPGLPPAESPAESTAGYTIYPSDVVRIEAFIRPPRQTEAGKPNPLPGDELRSLPIQPISGRYKVRADGSVYLGVYGAVQVEGLTDAEAADRLRAHLAKLILPEAGGLNPEYLTVLVATEEHAGMRYYVVTEKEVLAGGAGGAIGQPVKLQMFSAAAGDTLLDALSRAEVAGAVTLIRKADGKPEVLPADWITTPAAQYRMRPGDRLVVRQQ